MPEEIQYGLNTKLIAKKFFYYDEVESTNDEAYKLAVNGEPEGTVVTSELQLKGRGRLGRKWHSPKGKNVLASIILKPNIDIYLSTLITVIASSAVTLAIKDFTGLGACIKWPNDVMIANRKVCGILVDQKTELDRINFAVLGIGLNVNIDAEDFPEELKETSASIKTFTGTDTDRVGLFKKILLFLEERYLMLQEGRHADLIKEWQELSMFLGKTVLVLKEEKLIEGESVGIEKNGTLLVKDKQGVIHNVFTGDLVVKK